MKRLSLRSVCLIVAAFGGLTLGAQEMQLVARDPQGHGMLCKIGGKRVLIVDGTPEQMGAAHGRLLADLVPHVMPRTMALVGAGLAVQKGEWFFDRIDEIYRRSSPHTPERFLRECRAMASAAGITERDAVCGNFFPELFHCSGVAVRNTASADGRVVHARVLDYMRDINLQKYTVLQVFVPADGIPWVSVGYAGFLGTVTAMNARGLAIGEMGGRGEGNWDGMPMTFLMREIAERAETVEQAVEIMRKTPRTCEYYYVISDAKKSMAGVCATPEKVEVLQPGQQHPLLPAVPADTVMMSAGGRAKALSERLQANFGRITPEVMIGIIKRPVAMRSNLHNAVFMPETLDMWFADAGKKTPACDEPYTKVNLKAILDFYAKNAGGQP
ncbi:MAG TPA: C45 family autoproteolytic acyltransferase/hydrolase [Kiritimatiellia bacterium]|nr:C45 family autoproteolytic acyltransferase/hydrolase [Kiritimatiellia bacterium]HPS06231.1 C45 family autoproteolytic acyltransferase/hydrolase [Kiritimatiellia bacterium]